jgi:ferredoxin like protein
MKEDIFNLSLEDKLYRTKYETSEHSHIQVNDTVCAACDMQGCVRVCPAGVYSVSPNDPKKIVVSHDNCLECGTCLRVCTAGSVDWKYPDGGMGVKYRFG